MLALNQLRANTLIPRHRLAKVRHDLPAGQVRLSAKIDVRVEQQLSVDNILSSHARGADQRFGQRREPAANDV
jgi:hypothetical protein